MILLDIGMAKEGTVQLRRSTSVPGAFTLNIKELGAEIYLIMSRNQLDMVLKDAEGAIELADKMRKGDPA